MADSRKGSTIASRYARLAELCRESASQSWSPAVSAELETLALTYDHKAAEARPLVNEAATPATRRKSNRVAKIKPVEVVEANPARSAFRFAKVRRKRRLGATSAIHGSD